MKTFVNHNGKFLDAETAVLKADDHGYRYGDGLFETMKLADERILFGEFHFERLFAGLSILRFKIPAQFDTEKIGKEINQICRKNNCERSARVRLSVSRGRGGLNDCDDQFSYLIECWPLEKPGYEINANGLVIGIFKDAVKSIDAFSNLKSANYLPYVMAAIWAKENKLDDALILNQHQRICDATIANVFWVKEGQIFTPPLTEGCVAGVMRRKILELDPTINEAVLTEDNLGSADEVFLTNVMGIRWVKQYANKIYQNQLTANVLDKLNQTIPS